MCELVLPDVDSADSGTAVPQFARTPFAVSFAAGTNTFILWSPCMCWGSNLSDRLGERTHIGLTPPAEMNGVPRTMLD